MSQNKNVNMVISKPFCPSQRIIAKVITCSLFLGLSGCTEFDRSYSKLDGEFARALSFQYVEPEMAPGDTVTLRSYWSGKPINAANVQWGVSWEYVQNQYGETAVLDSQSLAPWIVDPMHEVSSEDSMQVFEMKFVIPDSIMRKSPGIPENWVDELAKYGQNVDLSGENQIIPKDKQELLTMLDSIAKLSPQQKAKIPVEMGTLLDGVCQYLTVGFKVHCDYSQDGGFNSELLHTVRYHSKMAGIPGIFTNHRPIQTGAKLYVVTGENISTFDPRKDSYEKVIVVTDRNLELTYNSEKSYFLAVDVDSRDSTITTEQALVENPTGYTSRFEELRSFWFYDAFANKSMGLMQVEDNSYEQRGIPQLIFKMNFGESGDIVRNRKMFYYLETSDRKLGVKFRPGGRDMQSYTITIH